MEPSPGQSTLEIYKRSHEAEQKFDYFVCTVAGAVFGYEAERFFPNRLAFNSHLLELVSLLSLALAFWFGLQKLRCSVLGTRINHKLNDSEEKSLQLARMLGDPKYQNEVSQQMMKTDLCKCRQDVDAANAQLPSVEASARRNYVLRDISFVFGFVAIVASKILQPYEVDTSGAANAAVQSVLPPLQIAPQNGRQAPPTQTTSKVIRPSKGVHP